MRKPGIKKLLFLFILFVFAFSARAQQAHFIYLQTDNGQPFYVKLNNKLVSSSSEGYVILPGVKDGVYQLVVGFPKKEFPEENFVISIDNGSEGFLLKDFEEKGWQLFNLQTLALIQGTNEKVVATVVKKDDDPFSIMLANVVKDSSILQDHDVVVQAPIKTDIVKVVKIQTTVVPDTQSTVVAKVKPPISRLLNKEDNEGLQRVYEDKSNSSTDTIRIFFPSDGTITSTVSKVDVKDDDTSKVIVEKNLPSNTPPVVDNSDLTITPTVIPDISSSVNGRSSISDSLNHNAGAASKVIVLSENSDLGNTEDSSANENKSEIAGTEFSLPVANFSASGNKKDGIAKQQDNVSLPEESNNKTQTEASDNHINVLPKEVTTSKVNSDCKAFATHEDFLKLRRKMAGENSVENMIKVAKKYFKLKCFSTEQIKDLSYLFLKDEGKYMFFDAAYAFTSDSDQYQLLQSLLTDEYFLNRFKAMINR